MANPRETRTNAADSAPGVDDGPAGVSPPPVNSKPGGRRAVWIGVIVACLLVILAVLARPLGSHHGAGYSTDNGGGPAAQESAGAPAGTQYGSH
jgi:hypothetical protein